MLRAIAGECDLTKTTLQHIKSVLSGIFTFARNEGAYDGANPIQDAMIPGNARDPEETHAYNLVQTESCCGYGIVLRTPRGRVARIGMVGLHT